MKIKKPIHKMEQHNKKMALLNQM